MSPLLPADILILIIEALNTPPEPAFVALPAWHATTKSLLALSSVCRVAYPVAQRILFSRCLHVDSSARLTSLLQCIRQLDGRLKNAPTHIPSLPPVRVLGRAQSLYLSPFPPATINLPTVAAEVHDLFALLATSLRTLVIDMPLRGLRPEDDERQVRPVLRAAFSQLERLESFCSVRDELYLSCKPLLPGEIDIEPPVWSRWTHLRVLALYNPDLSSDCWSYFSQLPNLRTLVATRADGLLETDLRDAWMDSGSVSQGLNVILVNTWEAHISPRGSSEWRQDDTVAVYEVSVPISYYGDEDPITTCQDWGKAVAMKRELESQYGRRLLHLS